MNLNYQLIRTTETEDVCKCSVKHIPNPLVLAEVDTKEDTIHLCPSGLFNLEDLLREYALTGGRPSGSITKHYGKYLRDLAISIHASRSTT